MRRKILALLSSSLFLLAISGCGSSRDSNGDTATTSGLGSDPVTGVAYAGATACIDCHQGFTWSATAVSDYLLSKHVIHSTHIDQQTARQSGCAPCHDPIGDGRSLESLIDPVNVPAGGLAAVTCEACHGAGGEHYGVGPMPNPTPDYNTCGNCHDALPINHLTYHPEANNIVTDYKNGGHFTNDNSHNSAVCSKCHTDEGAKLYRDVDNVDRLETVVLAVTAPSKPIQCRTCHNAHRPGELLEAATTGSNGASAEYRTCTNCHQAHDAKVGTQLYTLAGSTSTDGASDPSELIATRGSLIYHASRWNRIITATHYDDPATTAVIEGYTMNKKNERACRDCHNVHAADITINEDWAKSAHGGEIMETKELAAAGNLRTIAEVIAIKASGSNDVAGSAGFAAAWVHYDWDASGRQSCQRCHTATGAKNFMTGPATYVAANNDFSHLVGWSKDPVTAVITSSGQNEMLYCWSCHANNSGALRTPGAITEIYEGTPALPLVTVVYPDVAGSNVCMSCHLGRETGAVVKTKTGFDNLGFVNSHYLAAGGTVFGETGYTYGSRDYSIPASDTHVMIGRGTTGNAVVDATYTDGPCISCHFDSIDGSHSLSPLTEYAVGDVSLNPVCVNCHATRGAGTNAETTWLGTNAIAATLQGSTHKARYQAALEALKVQLAADGFNFTPGHPYFANTNWLTAGDLDLTGEVTGKNNMGAAFNYNLLIHEPGGVAHNRRYTRRMIYDSIDWLDNGALDYSVSTTLAALDPSTALYQASATSYLINAGTLDVNLGTAAERY